MEVRKKLHILPASGSKLAQASLLRRFVQKIKALFQPEEVEVEFNQDGDYTYTVVSHKRVA
jgi:hypothetical protein